MIEMINRIIKDLIRDYDLWNFLTLILLIPGYIFAIRYFFYSKKNIKNLNFKKYLERDNSNYPLKVYIEIRNYTGKSVVIKDSFFKLKKFLPDSKSSMDAQTRKIEVKFPNPNTPYMSEVDCLVRHKESIKTWIPLEPNQSDDEINKTLKESYLGYLNATFIWINDKPKVQKLQRKI